MDAMHQDARIGTALTTGDRSRALRKALARTDRRVQTFARQRPFVATLMAVGAGFIIGRLVSRSQRW